MTIRRLLVAAVLSCAWWFTTPALERHVSVAEVTPGMVGVGRTVYAGDRLEEFTVHVLGVLRNTIAPGRDLILARLEGGPLAKTGVIAGMSGSPVYIDGRLLGAVSYQLGSFPTEPIAGITPIAEMLEASRSGSSRAAATALRVPALADADAFHRLLAAARPPGAALSVARPDARPSAPDGIEARHLASLRRIGTPVATAGLAPEAAAAFFAALGDAGLVAVPASGGTAGSLAPGSPPAPALRPGDPVGVTLASGDYTIGATGTVTDVVGTAVYAFGHPFFGLGPTRLPMTTAVVHAILPSLTSSMKLASTGSVIGAFTQDRATVLAGQLGVQAETIPVALSLTSPGATSRTVAFDVAVDPFFTPLVTFVGVGSALSTFERDLGVNTYAIRATLEVAGQPPLTFDDVFSGDGAATAAASSVAVPLSALLLNDREPVRIQRLTITVATTEQPRVTTIQRVWLDTPDLRPGRPATVKVLLRPYRGPDEVRTVTVPLPTSSTGPFTLVVASGPALAQLEARDGFTNAAPVSLTDLYTHLQRLRRNNRLYVRLYARDAGAVVEGAQMPGLPNSVLAVLDGDRGAGGTQAIATTPVGAFDIALDHAVVGARSLTLTPSMAPRHP